MSSAAEDDPVLVTRGPHALVLTLNRARRGNALGAALVEALDQAFEAALAEGARLIAFTGRGRNFCTGLDLTQIETESDGDLLLRVVRIEMLLQKIHAAPVPTLVIASGRIFGAGADLFAACDQRLCLEDAQFSFPGPGFGLVLGTRRLSALVGRATARDILLQGRTIDAAEAISLGLAIGLVNQKIVTDTIAIAGRAAARLDTATVSALHRATQADDDEADLANLVRSAARPDFKARIQRYRETSLAARVQLGEQS